MCSLCGRKCATLLLGRRRQHSVLDFRLYCWLFWQTRLSTTRRRTCVADEEN